MKPAKTSLTVLLIAGLLLGVVLPRVAHGLTLTTTAAEPSVQGEPIEARLRVAAAGVQQDPKYPLDTVSGSVGETFEMGTLKSSPKQRVELEVTLPWGRYYRTVSKQELSGGTIPLTVYPDGENVDLEVSRHGILVQPFPKRLMVREYVVFRNNSQSMAGGKDNPIEFKLPEGMQRVIPGPGMGKASELTKEGDVYRYHNLVPPGESMVGFFYMIKPGSNTYTLERTVTVPTGKLAVRIPSYEKLTVTTEQLQKVQRPDKSGKAPSGHAPQIYRADNLESGETIRITFEGLNEISVPGGMGKSGSKSGPPAGDDGGMSRPSSFSNVSWPLILGIGFSVLIFVGSYGYVQYKLSQGPVAGVGADFLIREIANLDQEFEDGAIDEAYYKRTRRRWKQKAEELDDDEPA